MDLQTCNTHLVLEIIEISLSEEDPWFNDLPKTVKSFLNKITPNTRLLVEQPLMVTRRSTGGGGPRCYNVQITNLETMETLKMRITQLYDRVIRFIKEAKELM